jgi:hypothetical protein
MEAAVRRHDVLMLDDIAAHNGAKIGANPTRVRHDDKTSGGEHRL